MSQKSLFADDPAPEVTVTDRQELILIRLRVGPATDRQLGKIDKDFGGLIHELRGKGFRINADIPEGERETFWTLTE